MASRFPLLARDLAAAPFRRSLPVRRRAPPAGRRAHHCGSSQVAYRSAPRHHRSHLRHQQAPVLGGAIPSTVQRRGDVKRLVIGGATFALVSALAALAPTGASAPRRTHAPEPDTFRQGPVPTPTPEPTRPAPRPSWWPASRTTFKASRHDRFRAGRVLSSGGLMYVPYERTYKGLPRGRRRLRRRHRRPRQGARAPRWPRPGRPSVKNVRPTVSKANAKKVSSRGVKNAKAKKTRLVVLQQKRSTLAWETWVTGRKHGEPTRLAVYVGARSGKRLHREGARAPRHRQRQLGGRRALHPDDRLRLVVLDDEQQRQHPALPELLRATRPSPAPTTRGATAAGPTARPAASTRSTPPRRCAR